VALAVMSIGMLGVAGMQSVLRVNADNAKQRTEAVRITQLQMEDWRSFTQLSGATASYEMVGKVTPPGVSATVQPALTPSGRLAFKSVAVEAKWLDRAGAKQTFVLASGIAGMPPALASALSMPALGDPVRTPAGRHRAIPPGAVVEAGGETSRFSPPGMNGVYWRFSHDTGLVIESCQVSNPGVCTPGGALISGYIRYAYGSSQPTAIDAQRPASPAIPTTLSLSAGGSSCAVEAHPAAEPPVGRRYLAYYCLVPLTGANPTWTGKVVLSLPNGTGLPPKPIAATRSDADSNAFKVCRYTPEATHSPPGGNDDHPLQYTALARSVSNKNFLVIAAGSGTPPVSHECPIGPPALNTFWHQPE
jgi:hypothetical protein